MARSYSQADIKILYGRAAERCAFPSCRAILSLEASQGDKAKQIGEIAHIVAHSKSGPRADPTYPGGKLDTYDNLILLCPTCHKTVDAQESKFSVDKLRQLKADHESWVSETLDQSMPEITFAELEIAAKAIASGQHYEETDLSVIPPGDKIKKNRLTNEVRILITMGLSQSPEVSKFLVEMAKIDSEYPGRLRNGFKAKYLNLKTSFSGDALFMALLEFAKAGQNDFKMEAACLAILVHLFQICEVFEK